MTITKKFRQFAAAALMLAAPAAQAALPYTDGDLILGFRATGGQGGTTCYEVNIGSASQFVSAAASFTVNLGGNIATDLAAIYGDDWKIRSDVFWSISGTQFSAANGFTNRTVFASKAETTAGTQSSPWLRVATGTQNPVAGDIQTLGTRYALGTVAGTPGQTESTNSTKALSQDTGAISSYASFMPGGANTSSGSAFKFFVNGALGIENTFAGGTIASVLDLYQLPTGSVGTNATFLGAFRLNDSGVLTYSPNPSDFSSGPAPAQVAFSSAGYSVNEDAGMLTVELVRTVNVTTAFTVNVSTADGSALAGTDYTAQSSVPVAFAASDVSKTLNIPIIDRALFQGNRAFSVTMALASGTATIINPTSATVTIAETDPQPATLALSAATYSVIENAGNAVVTINRTGSTVGPVSVDIATSNGTALSGTDYTAPTTTVNFADGETSKAINIPVADRAGYQGDRSFTATISNPTAGSAVLGTITNAAITIQDNETQPSIALSAATFTISETAGTVAIGLVRTGDIDTACSVNFATSGGTAIAGSDYVSTNTTVNFAATETTKTVTVGIIDAAGFQGSRTFNATLSNAIQAGLTTPSSAVITITDNEQQSGPATAGNYSGLIKSAFLPPTVKNTGAVALKVTSTGAFTGKVFIGGTSFSISGTFGTNGTATFKGGSVNFRVALKTKPETVLGNLRMTSFGDSLGGTLVEDNDDPDVLANLTAERLVPYDGKTPQTTVPATILDTVTKGYHTGVIPSKAQTSLANDKFPQGDGVVSFTVSKKGAFKAAGTLADGTKFSAASGLNKLNSAPLFAQLYKKKTGLISVSLKFDSTRADSDALGADLLWIRPADAAAKQYPDGWPAGITLDMLAARYRAPQKGDTTSAFPGLGADNLTTGNATLTAADGKLTAAVVKNVNISAKDKVTNAPATDKTFKLAFTAKKGTLAGTFTHTDGTKPKFTGIVFQKGPLKGGYGYFLSTKPKTGPAGEGGGITLLAK